VRALLGWVLVHRVEGPADTPEPLLLRAEASYAVGQVSSAVFDLRELLKTLPDENHEPGPPALLRLGDCLVRLGSPASAATVWERTLAARPASPHAALRLGYLALSGGRPEEAHRHLRRATEFLPTATQGDSRSVEHAVLLGLYALHRAKSEDKAAEQCLAAAANTLPDDPVTAAEQAILATDRGDHESRQQFTQTAVARATRAHNGLPVLDLLHNRGLLTHEEHRVACDAHRTSH